MSNPAGWYPQQDGQQRYWDGEQWTDNFAPGAASVTSPSQARKNWFLRHKVVTAIGAVLLFGTFSSLTSGCANPKSVSTVVTKPVTTPAADKAAASKAAAYKAKSDKMDAEKEATPTEESTPAAPDPATTSADYSSALSVTDSGWGVIMDNSFATWAAVITNTSDAWLKTDISAVAVNAAGAPVDTSALTEALAPNSTSRVGGTFENATGVRGVKVQAAPNFALDHALYNGDTTLTGTLTGTQYDTKIAWTLKSGLDSTLKQGAEFFAVFRDRAGHIVGGGSSWVPVTVAPGATQAFATTGGELTAPDAAVTVEGWVNPEGFVGAS